jgi:DNA-binding beta-propeller fold protein YncE
MPPIVRPRGRRGRIVPLALSASAISLLLLAGCLDVLSPDAGNVAYVGGTDGRIAAVALSSGQVGSWLTRLPPYQEGWTLSSDSSTIYWSTFVLLRNHILLSMDRRSLRILSEDSTSAIILRSQQAISIYANYAIAVTPDNARLLVADAQEDTTIGIAVLDAKTYDLIAFLGPLAVGPHGIGMVRPNSVYPYGAILVAGSRSHGHPSSGVVFIVDPVTLNVADSVILQDSVDAYRGGLGQVSVSGDGVHAFILSSNSVLECDVAARRLIHTATRQGTGQISVAPDGQRVYLPDMGTLDFPGTGHVFVYDSTLTPLPSIDLSGAARPPEGPPALRTVVVSPDQTLLYVVAGTGRGGFGAPDQLGRLFVVDARTYQLRSTIDLSQYITGWMLLH